MSNDHEILADRLNAEPAIFKGCSSSELGMIVGLAIVIWLPLSLLLAWLLGAITMGFGIAGRGVRARRFPRRARREQEIDLAHLLGEGAAAQARLFAHVVVFGARHLPAFVEARPERRGNLVGVVGVFPGERARVLVAHDHLVAVEEGLASRRQLEVRDLRTGTRECGTDRGSDGATATGDEGDPIVEPEPVE